MTVAESKEEKDRKRKIKITEQTKQVALYIIAYIQYALCCFCYIACSKP